MVMNETLTLYGIEIRVEHNNTQLEKSLNYLNNLFNAVSSNPLRRKNSSPIFLKLNAPPSIGIPKDSKLLTTEQSPLRIYQREEFLYLVYKETILKIDFVNDSAIGYFEPSAFQYPRMVSHTFLLSTIVFLMHSKGFFHLHAAALEKDDHGCLIVGKSGSGKSTDTIHLVEEGWKYLSDDIILLQYTDKTQISVHAIPTAFKFNQDLMNHHSKDYLLEHSFEIPHNDKKLINIQNVFPDQFIPYCFPSVIILPKIVEEQTSRLIPISDLDAFSALIKESPFILIPHKLKEEHIDSLKKLVKQSKNFRLLAGKDLLKNSENLSKLILMKLYEDNLDGN